MGLRQTLNEKPAVGYGLAAGAVLLVAVVLFLQFRGGGPRAAPETEFFTVDDGQTWFEAPATSYPPFEHEGRTAYRAAVFECDGEEFVGYVQRYTPDIRERLAAAAAAGETPDTGLMMESQMAGLEVRRPDEEVWVGAQEGEAFSRVTDVRCPDGDGRARPVFP